MPLRLFSIDNRQPETGQDKITKQHTRCGASSPPRQQALVQRRDPRFRFSISHRLAVLLQLLWLLSKLALYSLKPLLPCAFLNLHFVWPTNNRFLKGIPSWVPSTCFPLKRAIRSIIDRLFPQHGSNPLGYKRGSPTTCYSDRPRFNSIEYGAEPFSTTKAQNMSIRNCLLTVFDVPWSEGLCSMLCQHLQGSPRHGLTTAPTLRQIFVQFPIIN